MLSRRKREQEAWGLEGKWLGQGAVVVIKCEVY
jgi:hypothetical protein